MTAPLLVELPSGWIVVLNIAFWAVAHAGTGYAAHRLGPTRLADDGWLLRVRAFERPLHRALRVRRWKDHLPEAGATFPGGISKRHLPERLEVFERETRRAELAHWWAATCGPLAVIWNPWPGVALMVLYGVAVNAPFIVIQRFNRSRVQRLLAARERRRA